MTEPVTGFRFELTAAGSTVILAEGFADAPSASWSATVEFTDPSEGKSRIMRSRSAGGSVWMQMDDWPDGTNVCWLGMGPTQVPLGVQALVPLEPTYLPLLAGVHATGFRDSSQQKLVGTAELRAALTLLTAQMFEHIEISEAEAAAHTVAVEISHENGRVDGIVLLGEALLAAIKEAGGVVAAEVEKLLPEVRFSVNYPPHSPDVTVSPPPDHLVSPGDGINCLD